MSSTTSVIVEGAGAGVGAEVEKEVVVGGELERVSK